MTMDSRNHSVFSKISHFLPQLPRELGVMSLRDLAMSGESWLPWLPSTSTSIEVDSRTRDEGRESRTRDEIEGSGLGSDSESSCNVIKPS